MRKLIFGSAVLFAMAACSQNPPTGYTISGTAEGTQDGDTVYLCEMQGYFSMNPLDSAYVKNGKFEFKGEAEGANLRFLVPIHGGKPTAMAMFILENADIKATLKPEGQTSLIEGGPNQKLYDEYTEANNKLSEQMNTPWNTVNDSTADEATRQAAQQTLDSLQQVSKEYTRKFIVDHVPSAISDMLLAYNMQSFSEDEVEEILKLFGEKQPDFPFYKAIMAEREATKATAVGAQYTDIQMPAPDGKVVKVSDYVSKNKLTLIDFWASWCGPCRAEMPTVVKAYTDYHAKGFEVVGVSLDNNKDAWVKAIDQLKMPWPQMSDLKGWDSEGAQKYNVRSIPANVLVDQKGVILAKDLRGEDLLQKVAELLK
ncbi:MAG: AhpC/TSA family protein [Prevotella sp.]|nr:AhpC/TSA family protein [Prevotella sp.]